MVPAIADKVVRLAAVAVIAALCAIMLLALSPQQAQARTFLIGDSRGCWLYNTLHSKYDAEIFAIEKSGHEVWKTRICMGSVWFDSVCAPYIEKNLRPGDDVVISLGVNDMWNAASYARSVNRNAAQWQRAGANTYFVSVTAVEDEESARHQFYQRDIDTKLFNAQIQQMLDPGVVTYIDLRSRFDDGEMPYHTGDGLHYDDKTGRIVYKMLYNSLDSEYPEPMRKHFTPVDAVRNASPLMLLVFLVSVASAWAIAGQRRQRQGC